MKRKVSDRPVIALWHRVDKYGSKITPVAVVSFTDKTVTVREKRWSLKGPDVYEEIRSARSSEYHDFFPDFAAAKEFLANRLRRNIEATQKNLLQYQADLEAVTALKESA